MQKHNSDYIPTAAERIRSAEERREQWKTIPDIRKTYECKYYINNTPIVEKITAVTLKDAEEHVRQQCGMVGWIPANLQVHQIEDNVVEVK